MKVVIGPYRSWIGPYQIADLLCFWVPKRLHENEVTLRKPDWTHDFGTWLATNRDGSDSSLYKFCNWLESKRNRQIYVRIDDYDTWSMDHTLALIVVPMLKQLKATKTGAPQVDDSDVPKPIRSTAPGARDRCEEETDHDEHYFERWDYVLSEMIWAFEQKIVDDADSEFYDHGTPVEGETFQDSVDRIKIDHKGLQAYENRKTNGFRLFGKYYQALWN
jgi:hypothetical protein